MRREEENVAMTAQLYDCRRTARSLLGAEYDARIKPWCDVIAAHQERTGKTSALSAAIHLTDRLYDDADGIGLMLLFAAAVELIEKAQADHARFTPVEEGKAIGSAEDRSSSSVGLSLPEGVKA